jgi:heterodisulfide reductase subunit A
MAALDRGPTRHDGAALRASRAARTAGSSNQLDPVATMTDGIFIAGTSPGPKDIPDSVAQGAAAAAGGRHDLPGHGDRAGGGKVAAERCSAAGSATRCPFNAIFRRRRGVSVINAALCKGWAPAWPPARGRHQRRTNDLQIEAEIDGVPTTLRKAPAALAASAMRRS